jgi:septal ring factor EnvC (AmiA/AmiB activator)
VADDLSIGDRVNRLEWETKGQGERMNQGAEAFSSIRTALEDVKEQIHAMNSRIDTATLPTPVKWSWVLGFGFAVLTTLVSVLWRFAQYPDRDEFDNAAGRSAQIISELQEQLGSIEREQVNLAAQDSAITVEVQAQRDLIREKHARRKRR